MKNKRTNLKINFSNLVADLISGKSGSDAVDSANTKLALSREKIADLIRNPDFSKTANRKRGRSGKKRKNVPASQVRKTVSKKRRPIGKNTYSVFDEDDT